jgi:hypothetical protein
MAVHFDHAIRYTAKCTINYLRANRLRPVPYPAFPLDLAPSDFYLFGRLRMALMGAAFVDDDRLSHDVMSVLNGISREKLEAVFEEWLLRFDRCIQQNGEYGEQGVNKHILIISTLSCVAIPKFAGNPCRKKIMEIEISPERLGSEMANCVAFCRVCFLSIIYFHFLRYFS